MTEKQFQIQIDETLAFALNVLKGKCESFKRCGAVDFDTLPTTNYAIARALVCAALLDTAHEQKPIGVEGRVAFKNLRLF